LGVIGSLRGLLVLGGFAVALAGVAIFDRAPASLDRAILPGFDPAKLADLAWKLGDREIHLGKSGDHWIWIDPPGPAGVADPDAIDRVVTAIRGGRWQRRAGVVAAGALRGELALSGATIGIGQPLAGTAQAWLVVDGEALLVDGWIANALAPDPLALRPRIGTGTSRRSARRQRGPSRRHRRARSAATASSSATSTPAIARIPISIRCCCPGTAGMSVTTTRIRTTTSSAAS
jgi:hypothetical protein